MKKTFLPIVLILLPGLLSGGKSVSGGESVLDTYIRTGLSDNLALRQHQFSLEKSLAALNEAKRMFYPTIAVQARYTRAGGGRLIEFPIGDLMNPVYSSLNDLYRLQGMSSDFPTNLQNERFPFYRSQEQETKIRLVQPLVQPALHHNVKIRSGLSDADRAKMSAFARELVGEIQTAYYNYLKSHGVFDLLEKTEELLQENLRVSDNLVRLGKATEDTVFRARAEIADLEQKRAEAEKNESMARSYFNFLLNRELDEEIEIVQSLSVPPLSPDDLEAAVHNALLKRDEFRQLDAVIGITGQQEKLAGAAYLPTLTAVVDYGFQGERYSLAKDDDYWMASLVFEWNIFDGGRNKAKKTQATLEKNRLEIQRTELVLQIRLQVVNSAHALKAARKAVEAAEARERSARESFEIVQKKY
ncbi:MAG: TolC family protein, partial [Candidatus Aminicenantes bacterium]|nr:TolC family protein [Candidatus Aminicenantes bacterium]